MASILIADDNKENRYILEILLQKTDSRLSLP
jgi:CheY-like chemotaxis protein